MALDVFVGDLELVRTTEELDRIISRIKRVENEIHNKSGIVLKQNNLGGSYRVVSEEQAKRGLSNSGIGERYIEFYTLQELNRLKTILEGEGRKKYLDQLHSFRS
ncbi:hypothetical protein J4436_03340 [Candidatus Woesearchaeota archaeon]|nr:hypothetical protein [Candidatus Woesearchaeota archaeon]